MAPPEPVPATIAQDMFTKKRTHAWKETTRTRRSPEPRSSDRHHGELTGGGGGAGHGAGGPAGGRAAGDPRPPSPPDAAAAACACRRFAAAASSPALPLALALSLGVPPPSPLLLPSSSPAAARRLLRSLHRLRRLLGVLAPPPLSASASSPRSASLPSLAAFEWAPRATLAASLLSPSENGVGVTRSPFVTLSIVESGDTVASIGDVPVCLNFLGNNHIVVEAAANSGEEEEVEMVSGSPPEEMYAHFANRRSPGAGRRKKGRHGKRFGVMEPEHFVRITDVEPTKARPLQGLWKVPPLCRKLALLLLQNVKSRVVCIGMFDHYYMVYWYGICGVLECATVLAVWLLPYEIVCCWYV
ncbi:hypothetical protein PR202_ga12332 [Eleusine coracana subsp. coracana]|uniref:Uncharacterized protein n=1 Tax=Eleusine coracana subsp. coracana TaxID=191504 RepID=A0AAV5CBV4_ELECO|nr:hypothetical protein PR202_ga12332 [Eleusine coracana subsp. coracana]